jgi:hypothetical protein
MASGLMCLVLVAIVSLGMTSGTAWTNGSQRLITDDRASLALQALCQDARSGSTATVSGNVLTVTSPTTTSSGDFDRTVASTVTTRYYLYGDTLYKQTGTLTPVRLGSKISAVSFAISGSRISVSISSRQQTGARVRVATMTSDIILRNPLVN